MGSIADPAGWPEWARPFRPRPRTRSAEDDDAAFIDALLDVVFGPPTIPPGDGATAGTPPTVDGDVVDFSDPIAALDELAN